MADNSAPDGDVYGGYEWNAMMAQLMEMLFNQQLQQAGLMGWMDLTDDAGNVTKTPTLSREQWEEAVRQADQEYLRQIGLDKQQIDQWNKLFDQNNKQAQQEYLRQIGLDQEAIRQFDLQHGLNQQVLQLQAELGRGGLGMDYFNLLGSLKGPEDWVQYANVQRAAEQTDVPAWARMLVEGVTPAAFQGASGPSTPASIPGMLQPTTTPTTPSAPATGGLAPGNPDMGFLPGAPNPNTGGLTPGNVNMGMQGAANPLLTQANHSAGVQIGASQQPAAPAGQSLQQQAAASMPQWMAPLMQGHSVRSDQYQNLQPFERAMLAGAVNANSGNFDDWLYQLQQAAPKGQATGQSFFGGW